MTVDLTGAALDAFLAGPFLATLYLPLAERMVERYLGGVFPPELDREGHVLRLKPERLRSWSFSDWFA